MTEPGEEKPREVPADSDSVVEYDSFFETAPAAEPEAEPETLPPPERRMPSGSQRRLVPPESRRKKWWVRHRNLLIAAEWAAIAGFTLLFLYLLYTFIVPAPPPVRPAWGAEAEPGRWQYVVVHHSATAGGSPESMDRYHREENKWENGLGYHFVIGNGTGMPDGEVAVGPRWQEQLDGAHVRMADNGGANAFSIGIVLVGDFETAVPTSAQLVSLIRLLRFLSREYGISYDRVVGHGEVSARHTLCPGKNFPLENVKLLAARRR